MVVKTKSLITSKTLIADIVEKWPDLAEVLVEDYGFHCIGCYASGMESISQGAKVHGMGRNEIKVMIENLNELVAENKKN